MWFLVILNALAKNIIPLIRQKSFLEENKERGNGPMTSPTEGGSGGASPPAFTRTTSTSKSPSEAVFILLEVTPQARQPLMSCFLSVTLSRAYKWN